MKDKIWYLFLENKQEGPYSDSEIKGFLKTGKINSDSFIWKDGFADWQAVKDTVEIKEEEGIPDKESDNTEKEPVNYNVRRTKMNFFKFFLSAKPKDDESIRILSEVELFESLTLNDLENISLEIEERDYNENEVIVKEKDAADGMYIVKEGAVNVIKLDKNGNESVITTLGDRSYFGEMALIDNIDRTATIKTIRPTTVYFLNKYNFFRLLKKETRTSLRILFNISRTLSRRLENTTKTLIEERSKNIGD